MSFSQDSLQEALESREPTQEFYSLFLKEMFFIDEDTETTEAIETHLAELQSYIPFFEVLEEGYKTHVDLAESEEFLDKLDEEELDDNELTDFDAEIDQELENQDYIDFLEEMNEEELDDNELTDFDAESDQELETQDYIDFLEEMDEEELDEEGEVEEEFLVQPVNWVNFESEQNAKIPLNIIEFVKKLGNEWWSRRGSDLPTAKAIANWLLQDYQNTITGARHRWGQRFNKGNFTIEKIGRAWMIGRQENMLFQNASSTNIKSLKKFVPPSSPVSLISSSLIKSSDKAPIAPIVIEFVKELRQRYQGYFRASTYRGHGGGKFDNRGYSIDLFLDDDVLDSRGFYPQTDAIKFLRAVEKTAKVVNGEWRAIYNDFSVANTINRETGKKHVIFVGKTRNQNDRVKNLNWHGPYPLILHFHLDLIPRQSRSTENSKPPSTGKIEPSSTKSKGSSFYQRIKNALRRGFWSLALGLSILEGLRSEKDLTNMIFYARHPEMNGRRIKRGERALANEWKAIQVRLVRPALRMFSVKRSPTTL